MKIQSVKFERLHFGYEGHELLFEEVDFEFPMNEITWVKAESGTGRSSLLQLMAGLLQPRHGKYLINDQNVTEMSFEEFLPFRLAIGYGFDFGGLIHNRTLVENLTLPLLYHKSCNGKEAKDKAEAYFERLGAAKFRDKRPSDVPGGIRKLTCLIRALITEPQILLLDDPSIGLGQETSLKYFDCIQELRAKGKAQHVFVSSFDDKLMSCIPHREILLDCGQLHLELTDREKKVVSL